MNDIKALSLTLDFVSRPPGDVLHEAKSPCRCIEIARHDRIHGLGLFRHSLYTEGFTRFAASWVGLFSAQQYTAAKHGVLGLMRSLDPIVASENIRTACIHPWFAGKPFPTHLGLTLDRCAETNIIDLQTKLATAGMPKTPVERVAGAIFRAATDPDPDTSGCPWTLPDDGPVLLLKKEVLHEGVYEMLNNRVRRLMR